MAKKITPEDMMTIQQRLDDQDQDLKEILRCLKGDTSINYEGVIPAQIRIEQELKSINTKMDTEIASVKNWQENVQKYFDVINSPGIKRTMIIIFSLFIGIIVYIKGGFLGVYKFIHALIF